MPKAIIVNTIKDAISLSENRSELLKENTLVFSTHVSVDVYLKGHYQIDCRCLSIFLSPDQIAENLDLSDKYAQQVVDHLDSNHSEDINKEAGLQGIRFFRALYAYPVYAQFITCLNMYEAIKAMIDKNPIEEIIFFDKSIYSSGVADIALSDILGAFISIKMTRLPGPVQAHSRPKRSLISKIEQAAQAPKVLCRKMVLVCWQLLFKLRCGILLKNRNTILLAGPLYDLSFLQRCLFLSKFNLLYYESDSDFPVGMADWVPLQPTNVPLKAYSDDSQPAWVVYFKNTVIKGVEKSYNRNRGFYAQCLKALDRLNSQYDIKIGIWGCPPVVGAKSLVFEYLLQKNKPVVGAQHGGLEVNIYHEDIYITKLTRCSDFISYGFSKDDVKKVFPEMKMDHLAIHEFGTTKKAAPEKPGRPVVDILFPITITSSMLDGGMKRNAPEIILDVQLKLLTYLDALPGHRIVVKPLPYSNQENLAVFSILEKAKNVQLVNDRSFEDVLNNFDVKAVLIDQHSTALYEALAQDLEIFLLNTDEVRPFEQGALNELKKRVYYAKSVEEMIPNLDLFLKGKLEKKRDNAFYHHYVHKQNTEKSVLDLIENLIEKSSSL